MTKLRRSVAVLLIACMSGLSLSVPAQATMIGTESVATSAERARIADVLGRADVRAKLESLGVNPTDVQARVDALSDREAADLVASIDAGPAGGSDLLTVALVVFLVLLFTDLMGWTKIFPFTKDITK